MAYVLEFKTNNPEIGLSLRTQTQGPEADLLNEFVGQYIDKIRTLKQHYALFYEPLLPTGYPDLVIVSYTPNKYESWTKERMELGVLELKVLRHLYFVKKASISSIEHQLGIDHKRLLMVLEKLIAASMVRQTKQQWLPRPLSNIYGINHIKSIEAKISDWLGVMSQANMNRCFSSESCVLSPISKPSEKVTKYAQSNGIGIYIMPSGMQAKMIQKPNCIKGLPVSYTSWLFNEWIGRQLFKKRGLI